jgi:hypothetical protein
MDPWAILFFVVLGAIVLLVILTALDNGLRSHTASRSANHYTSQISEAGDTAKRNRRRASDSYLNDVRDITRR